MFSPSNPPGVSVCDETDDEETEGVQLKVSHMFSCFQQLCCRNDQCRPQVVFNLAVFCWIFVPSTNVDVVTHDEVSTETRTD